LEGRQHPPKLQTFYFDLYSDAVDWDPRVNRCRQVIQGQLVLEVNFRRNKIMEWLVNMAILLEATNYFYEHDVICTYIEGLNMVQGENKAQTVYHGEPTDQVLSDWHSINGTSEENIPKFIIVHDSEYDQIFIVPLKSKHEVSINHHIRELRESNILWYNLVNEKQTMEAPEILVPSKVISHIFWRHRLQDETCRRMGRNSTNYYFRL
jgi:hypothetical protein